MDFDPLETCPHNPAHRILRSRMQYHLVKCNRQHVKTTKKHCYFDTTHVVDEVEFEAHLATCPSNGKIHIDRFVTEPQCAVGIPLEEVNNIKVAPPCDDWDKEPAPLNTYKPEEHIGDRNIIRTTMTISKAQRKKYRQAERQRFQTLSESSGKSGSAGPPPLPANLDNKPIRAPRNLADAGPPIITRSTTTKMSLNSNVKDETNHKNNPAGIHDSDSSHSKENLTLRMKENSINQVQSGHTFTQHCNEGTNGMNTSGTKLKDISSSSLNKPRNLSSSLITTSDETQKKAEDSTEFSQLRQKIKSSATVPTCSSMNSTNNGNQRSKLLPPTGRGCSRLYQQIENLNLRPGMRQEKAPDKSKQTTPISNGGYSSFIGYGSFDDSEISSDLNLEIENLAIK